MMLFLFVLMLVGVDSSDSIVETIKGHRIASFVLVVGLAGVLFATVGSVTFGEAAVKTGLDAVIAKNKEPGNVTALAELIFGQYVWIFEITSALLITAALGSMVLAHRERLTPKLTQAEWAVRRVKSNENVAGLPAPGVYARHNAVDTPALLPDGSPSALSVSRVLAARDQVATTDGIKDVERHLNREIEEGSAQ
jgi:NADH-quinone oxidoreductase subunit J